jgi:hypothetical protein
MIWFLRILFATVLASMLAVTSWASLQCALFDIPREVYAHPWFIATLTDAYWGFITFYVWAAWKEQGNTARALWLVAVLALGNIAMAAYFLRELFAVKPGDDLSLVFTRRNPGRLLLPAVLVGVSVAIYALALA